MKSPRGWRCASAYLFLAALVLAVPAAALAQTGKLAGRIVDAAGEPVIGATVFIQETAQGAAADLNGDYSILQVPPGTYSVRFTSIGYQTHVVQGVRVASNQTATLDVTLSEAVLQADEVVVTADRPVVDVTLTSSMSTLTREDIAVLPVQNLDQIVNLQAGVVDGHFRGGREGEVQYQVEGLSVNNPYNNKSTLNLDRSVLQEVQVISGTFDAEYGQAMSGVVNAVLRSGEPDRYEFSFETFVGDYLSPGNDSTVVRNILYGEQTVGVFPHIDDFDPLALQNFQASLSGPVPLLPKTTFLVNGQRLVNEGYLYGTRIFMPTDTSNFLTGQFYPTGDSAAVPLEYDRRWSYLGKITNRSIPKVVLDYQAVGSVGERQGYNHGFRFNPEGAKSQREFSIVHGFDLSHTLSTTTFYELGVRQNYFNYKDLKYESVYDPRYFAADRPVGDPRFGYGAAVQGVDLGRFVQSTNAFVGKGALTSQVTKSHLVKTGFEVMAADLRFGAPGLVEPRIVNGVLTLRAVTDTLNAVVNQYRPVQGAAFIQDRIEWRDLRIRAGLRLEYFDANSTIPNDFQNPAGTIEGAPPGWALVPTTTKLALAPRLGVSFPILDRTSLFFSYGHFYQMPGLGIVFDRADFSILQDLQDDVVDYGVMGNPDLKPEFTTQYEFGFKSEVTPYLGLDLSLFYKDIRDLLGVTFQSTYTAAEYARFTNIDFGGVRGFTLALDQRGPGPITTSLDYTYQMAVGNASDPKETANRAAAGGDPRPRQVPFNWDQRNTLNATAIWSVPNNYALTAIARLAAGQPFTPEINASSGAEPETNSGRKPGFFLMDLRAEKFFGVGGTEWSLFGRVFNLFDQRFSNGFVYADTGSPYYTLNPQAARDPDPDRFTPPRRIEIGLSFRGVIPKR